MAIKKERDIQLVEEIILGIENVKGENICVLDFTELENIVCKYFVICDCKSSTQVNAISNSIKRTLSKNIKEKPFKIEGLEKKTGFYLTTLM
jgi:ribosome-associated protein